MFIEIRTQKHLSSGGAKHLECEVILRSYGAKKNLPGDVSYKHLAALRPGHALL
jgi:hypothetical protein